jgi:hypothetical protein
MEFDDVKWSEYLSKTQSELYSLLGQEVTKDEYFDNFNPVEYGKSWFKHQIPKIREALCEQWKLCDKLDDPCLNDRIMLVATVASILVTLYTNKPVLLISVLVCKIGVRKFCECEPEKTKK